MENESALANEYIYITPNTVTDAKYTHLIKVKKIKMHSTSGYVEFEDALTGAIYQTTQGAFIANSTTLDLTVDGKTYKVSLADNNTNAPKIGVVYGTADIIYPAMELKYGEWIAFLGPVTGLNIANGTTILTPTGTITTPTINSTTTLVYGSLDTGSKFPWNITTNAVNHTTRIAPDVSSLPMILMKEQKDSYDLENFVYISTVNDSSTGVDLGDMGFPNAMDLGGTSVRDSNIITGLDFYGTATMKYNPTGDNDISIAIYYPKEQVYGNVFISPLAAKVSSTSAAGAVALNPISVGMAILDSQATLDGNTPYIVVGGPCANTIAAELLGNQADCTAGFTGGKAKIRLFADKNALLVAGYTGRDTQGACRVLAAYQDYSFSGTELSLITANMDNLTIEKTD